MIVRWSAEALDDLAALHAYIAQHNAAAADRIALEIVQSVRRSLPDHPYIGRPGRVSGTRELVIPRTDYIVPYQVRTDIIEILRVYHAARRWPETF
jgi:toxin ParE1/3/4